MFFSIGYRHLTPIVIGHQFRKPLNQCNGRWWWAAERWPRGLLGVVGTLSVGWWFGVRCSSL